MSNQVNISSEDKKNEHSLVYLVGSFSVAVVMALVIAFIALIIMIIVMNGTMDYDLMIEYINSKPAFFKTKFYAPITTGIFLTIFGARMVQVRKRNYPIWNFISSFVVAVFFTYSIVVIVSAYIAMH